MEWNSTALPFLGLAASTCGRVYVAQFFKQFRLAATTKSVLVGWGAGGFVASTRGCVYSRLQRHFNSKVRAHLAGAVAELRTVVAAGLHSTCQGAGEQHD